jgi:hypothetical protein
MTGTMNRRSVPEDSKWAAVWFRISGETLNPEEIGAALGLMATHSHLKGQRSRSNVLYRDSRWSLKSPLNKADSLDKHLGWLLDKLEPKFEEVRSLSQKYQIDFFCGFASVNGQGGFVLDGVMLARIAKFGVPLGIDLYPPPSVEEDEENGFAEP